MKQSLNFNWSFVEGYEESFLSDLPSSKTKIDIPHCAKEMPVSYFDERAYQKLFTYEKTFSLDNPKKKVHILTLDGVMLKARVYLNGVDLGEKISGWFPISFDISEYVKPRGNKLVVVVDGREDKTVPPFGLAVDYLTFAGIYREVHIDSYDLPYIKDIFVRANKNGDLKVETEVAGEGSPKYTIADEEGTHVAIFSGNEFHLDDPDVWSVDGPHLYTLIAEIGEEKREVAFGFRDAKWTKEGFFLNGEKLKLVGLNRHQNYPYVGPAMPKGAQYDDAKILKKDLGVNVVRTSHYADSEHFLDACDRLGLLLIDEVPGWQYIGKDEAWRNNFYDFVERLVKKERNHPCLIAYGLRIDESKDDHELYSRAIEIKNSLDPDRQCLGVRNFKGSECLEDIYAYNDFSCNSLKHGLDDPKTYQPEGKAVLVSENNGHMYPTRSSSDKERRTMQALRHLKVLNDSNKYDNLAGSIGWCAFDYNTHGDFGTGDHICPHGVYDIFRNPKFASYAYESQMKSGVFRVSGSLSYPDTDEARLFPLYVLTDCDEAKLYRDDKYVYSYQPDKKNFPNLKHPPIKIDNIIGFLVDEIGMTEKEKENLGNTLMAAGSEGLVDMSLKTKAMIAARMMKNQYKMDEMFALFDKYGNIWNGKYPVWRLEGYKDGNKVAEIKMEAPTKPNLEVKATANILVNDDTYDVSRVSIVLKDGELPATYTYEVAEASVSGPIEIIGPSNRALIGGSTAFYIRSKAVKEQSKATLTINVHGEKRIIEFEVN